MFLVNHSSLFFFLLQFKWWTQLSLVQQLKCYVTGRIIIYLSLFTMSGSYNTHKRQKQYIRTYPHKYTYAQKNLLGLYYKKYAQINTWCTDYYYDLLLEVYTFGLFCIYRKWRWDVSCVWEFPSSKLQSRVLAVLDFIKFT